MLIWIIWIGRYSRNRILNKIELNLYDLMCIILWSSNLRLRLRSMMMSKDMLLVFYIITKLLYIIDHSTILPALEIVIKIDFPLTSLQKTIWLAWQGPTCVTSTSSFYLFFLSLFVPLLSYYSSYASLLSACLFKIEKSVLMSNEYLRELVIISCIVYDGGKLVIFYR